MKRYIIISAIVFLVITKNFAQIAEQDEFYSRENIFGVTVSTNGGLLGGGMVKLLRIKKPKVFNTYTFEVAYIKHPKETRATNNPGTNVSFIPEKLNYFFSFRFQYGKDFVFFEKAPEEGVQVSGVLSGGPSLGLQKPYHVLYSEGNGRLSSVAYGSVVDDPNSKSKILGVGGFFDGVGDTKVLLGFNLKAALSFKFSTFGGVSGFEAGFILEGFTEEIELMARTENPQILTSAFVTIFFGNRK